MIDWTILSPTLLAATVEWAGAVVTVLAVGPGRSTTQTQWKEERPKTRSFQFGGCDDHGYIT